MASFNGSIDLLALNGAKVYTGIDQKNPNRAFVCIPVDLNEIKIITSRQNAEKQIAGLRVNMWPLNEQYKNKVRQSAIERGDQNVNVPTHELQINYSVDYVKAIAKAYPKLVEDVKEQNKQRDPDIVNQDAQDENTHLFKALRNRMNKRLAMMYQPQQTQQTAYQQPQSYQPAGQVSAYTAPVDASTDPFTNMDTSGWNNDLPF
jgi:hypothetical protein